MPARSAVVDSLLARHGTSYSEAVGVDLRVDTPATFWSWYVTCLLLSARIRSDLAARAARAYRSVIGTGVRATVDATWEERVRVLNEHGYARYDESTSRMLGDAADLVQERYDGDLRRLRHEAGGDADRLHGLLQQFPGVGPVGADIFCREAQVTWGELHPFLDDAAAAAADRLDLGRDPAEVLGLVDDSDVPRLLAALVRADRADDLDAVRAAEPIGPGAPRVVLDRLRRADLYELARDADLPGRSSMTRGQLVEELAR